MTEFYFRPKGEPRSGKMSDLRYIESTHGPAVSITRWLPSGEFWWSANTSFLLILACGMICVAKNVTMEIDYQRGDETGIGILDKDSPIPTIVLEMDEQFRAFEEYKFKPRPFEKEIPIAWRDGSKARTVREYGGLFLVANQPALLSIVSHIVSLAQKDVLDGMSLHYAEGTCLTEGSVPFIIQKQSTSIPPFDH